MFKAKQQQKLWMPLRLCFIGHIDFNLRLKIPCVLDVCLCMCMFSLHSIEYCQIQKGLWYSLLVHCLNWLSLSFSLAFSIGMFSLFHYIVCVRTSVVPLLWKGQYDEENRLISFLYSISLYFRHEADTTDRPSVQQTLSWVVLHRNFISIAFVISYKWFNWMPKGEITEHD